MFIFGTQDQIFALPYRWTPSLVVWELYDDNIYLVRKDQTSDFVTIIAPQFRISSTEGKVKQEFQYKAQYEWYSRAEELNTLKHFADLDWTARIKESGSLMLKDRFSFTPDSTEISSVGAVVPRGRAYGNDSSVGLHISRIDLSYQYAMRLFDDADLIDTQTHTFEERVALPLLSPREELTQSYRFRYFIEDSSTSLTSHTVGAGLLYHFSPTFRMGAEGGLVYWEASGDNSFQSKPTFGFNLGKDFKQLKLRFSFLKDIQTELQGEAEYTTKRTVFRMNYSKELTIGSGAIRGSVNQQTASASLQHTMGRRTAFSFEATYTTQKIPSGNLNRLVIYRGDARLTYALRSWLSVAIRDLYIRQDAVNPLVQEFARNQLYLGLTASMP